MTGEQALAKYLEVAGNIVSGLGGRIVSSIPVEQVLVGPADEHWDRAVIVYFPSRKALVQLGMNADFQKISRHRKACCSNYRLLHLAGASFGGFSNRLFATKSA